MWQRRFNKILIIPLVIILVGCGIIPTGQDPSTKATALAISIQQTVLARQGEAMMTQPDLNLESTQIAQANQVQLIQPTVETPLIVIPTSAATEALQDTPTTEVIQTEAVLEPSVTFTLEATVTINPETLYENANILLYEDIHQHEPTAVHYYRDALSEMGVNFTDVGSAKGNLKAELYAGAADGKPWDLVIIAAENHGSVPGEFLIMPLKPLIRDLRSSWKPGLWIKPIIVQQLIC